MRFDVLCSSIPRASSATAPSKSELPGIRTGLLTAAIVHWNSIYLDQAVHQLRAQGVSVPAVLLAHLAPIGWEHIALHRRL